jgi:hypothetical protein
MALPQENRTFNTLFSTTMDIYAEQASVNALSAFPLVDRLYYSGKAAVKEGGVRIDVGVRYGANPGAQWYAGADTLDMTPFESNTLAKYDWKQLHAPVTYTGEQIRKNRGAAAMLDLVTELIDATQLTLKKVLDIAMIGNGLANDGKVIFGLDCMFPTAATTDPSIGAIGGISAVGNPWWQNFSVTNFGSFAANGPKGSSQDLWLNSWDTVSDGSDTPEFILSSQDCYEFYHRANLGAVQIIMQPNTTGTLAFPKLQYMGADWYWDRNITNGRAYFLRSGDIEFWIQSGANMQLSEFRKAWNQDLYGASMLLMCAFFARRRMFTATIDGVTA